MRNLKSTLVLLLSLMLTLPAMAKAKVGLDHVEPMFWWANMHSPKLQLMVHGNQIGTTQVSLDYPGVELMGTATLDNPNYLFVNLMLAKDVKPGKFNITFSKNGRKVKSYTYELKQRREGSAERQGFNSTDVMYLLMPDRFANGDTSNDEIKGMCATLDRTQPGTRHGGDLKGVADHLDYIKDMGFTAIWMNPVLENNQKGAYHGYASTDMYKVDAHLGTNEQYATLSTEARKDGIKIIMDMIFNHVGIEHWWMKDLPSKDWVNNMPKDEKYTITNHLKSTTQDPYVSKVDKDGLVNGWFVPSMPDLNQKNPYLATYLIQNSIWWVEYADLSGIRMDTYSYPDHKMMADWNDRINEEYPNFSIVGEEWVTKPSWVAYWQNKKENSNGYKSSLFSLMDFPIQDALIKGLTEDEGWSTGLKKLYETLAMDFLYPDPQNLVIFPDNHDMSRYFTQLSGDFDLWKMGIAYTLTTRGIPQIYYGTEVLFEADQSRDWGYLRNDMLGGWQGDKINAFTGEGLTDQQVEAQNYLKTLLNWRKGNEVISHGHLKHFAVKDGVYVMFRYLDGKAAMTVLNKGDKEYTLDYNRLQEVLVNYTKGYNVLSGAAVNDLKTITVPGKSATVIELSK